MCTWLLLVKLALATGGATVDEEVIAAEPEVVSPELASEAIPPGPAAEVPALAPVAEVPAPTQVTEIPQGVIPPTALSPEAQRTYQRLFGPEEQSGVSSATAPSLHWGWWIVGVLALVGGALWYGRGRKMTLPARESRPLTVAARASLGGQSGLAIVEVDMGGGTTQRFLIGTGGGSPVLLAGLGLASFQSALDHSSRTLDEPAAPAEPAPGEEPPDPWPDYTRGKRALQAFRTASTSESDEAVDSRLSPRRTAAEARSLVETVLAGRNRGQRVA